MVFARTAATRVLSEWCGEPGIAGVGARNNFPDRLPKLGYGNGRPISPSEDSGNRPSTKDSVGLVGQHHQKMETAKVARLIHTYPKKTGQ